MLEDCSELIFCIENGNYVKVVRIVVEVGQNSMWIFIDVVVLVLEFLKVVWVKCSGYFFYLVLIIDFKMLCVFGYYNGVIILVLFLDVLKIGEYMQIKFDEKLFFVFFFDNKRSWQWFFKFKMVFFGIDEIIDKLKMMEGRNFSIWKVVWIVFDCVMNYLSCVYGELISDFSDID